jgi:uncharacterized membrane protein
MGGSKTIPTVVLGIGILILLGSALADIVGVGGHPQVFGYKQMAGTVVGAIIAAVGALLYWWTGREV